MRLGRKWRSFAAFPLAVQALVPLVVGLLGLARVAVALLPFRIYAPLLGRRQATSPDHPKGNEPSLDPRAERRVLAIKQAIRASATLTPWQSVCLPQALVAATLMRWAGIGFTVHLGLARGDEGKGPMQAHAWTAANGTLVTGAGQLGRYTRVASFIHDPRRREG